MRTIGLKLGGVLLLFCCMACSKQYDEPEVTTEAAKTTHLIMNGTLGQYDSQSTRITSTPDTTTWDMGDKIYITFSTDDGDLTAEATYTSSGQWKLQYEGTLPECSNYNCQVRYFENSKTATVALISFDEQTSIYDDEEAIYSHTGSTVYITAALTPKTTRVRFTGTPGDTVSIYGLSQYRNFSPVTNKYYTNKSAIKVVVGRNGYTPFIHGYIDNDNDERSISTICNGEAFTRNMSAQEMAAGQSGYLKIPTTDSHNKWQSGLLLKVNGVEFKMIAVTGHKLGMYLMGETEVTEKMYYAITGGSGTSSSKPQILYYNGILSYIQKLNATTYLNFCLPTESQWKFAARGGEYSQGYKYAGSDYADDVAWYASNCSSYQPVKGKMPNELGLYDMNGNAEEATCDIYSSNIEVTYVTLGGDYNSSFDNLMSYRDYVSDNSFYNYYSPRNSGFRLCLTID